MHVDCSAVTFFGSEGLSALALLMQVAPGGCFAELATSPAVERALTIYPAGACTGQSQS